MTRTATRFLDQGRQQAGRSRWRSGVGDGHPRPPAPPRRAADHVGRGVSVEEQQAGRDPGRPAPGPGGRRRPRPRRPDRRRPQTGAAGRDVTPGVSPRRGGDPHGFCSMARRVCATVWDNGRPRPIRLTPRPGDFASAAARRHRCAVSDADGGWDGGGPDAVASKSLVLIWGSVRWRFWGNEEGC